MLTKSVLPFLLYVQVVLCLQEGHSNPMIQFNAMQKDLLLLLLAFQDLHGHQVL